MIVYKITNIINNKAYVGQSQQTLEQRWSKHKSDAYRVSFNTHFYKAIRKYGTNCWKQEVLEEVNDINLLNEAEMKWIEYYNTFNRDKGYNSTSGGENGFIFSEETKEKMRQAKLNMSKETKEKIRQTQLGKHHTEETKEKIRQGNLGKKISEETKEKMSQANLGKISNRKGKKQSEESKEKMRQAKLGHIVTEETKEKMRQAQLGKKRGLYNKKGEI